MGKVGDVLELFRRIDRLLQLEEKHGKAIQALEAEHSALKERVTALEAREGMLVVEAASAARTASNQVTQNSLSDISRRLGRMEAMTEGGLLPGPEHRPATPALPAPKARARRRKAD